MNLTPDTVYCDFYYCPKHYIILKKNPERIKCHYAGCATYKCYKYHHCKLCPAFKIQLD